MQFNTINWLMVLGIFIICINHLMFIRSGPPRHRLEDDASRKFKVKGLNRKVISAGGFLLTKGAVMGTRKLFIGIVLGVLSLALCANVFAQENRILMTTGQQYQNMVPNASFESWDSTNTKPSDWTKVLTPTLTQDASVKRIGSNALKIVSDIGATSEGVSYTVTVEPRTTYTFSCYYYSAAANQAELEIDGDVTADLVNATGASALASTSATWKRYSVTFTTVTDTTVTIKLYAKADAVATKTAYFDGVSLSEGHIVPAFSAHTVSDTGNHTMYGNLTVEGTANLNGDVNLGNLSTDNITLKGTLKSSTDSNVTIQPQGTGIVSVSTNMTVTGTVTADGLTLGANENITLGTQTIKHDGTDFQFSDAIDLGTNVLDDTNLGYFLGWKHASDGSKMDGGDIYTGTVTTTQIATDTIVAADIATGAVGTTEILDGTIAPADIGMTRTSAQGTPDKTVAIASGSVYVSGNTLISYVGGTGNFGLGGNLVYTPTASGKYIKALISLNSAGSLTKTMGTEKVLAADAEAEGITYPIDELPIVEVILKTTGVTAGDVAVIESSSGTNSYIYRDVRPFINLGMSSATTSTSFTIGSGTDESANDISLLFGNTTGGQQSLVYAGSGGSAALDIFKLSDDLMLNSGADASTTDVVLTFGGTNSQTFRYDGDGTDNFLFSDSVDAPGYLVSGVALASTHLSDGANIAHINVAETVTGGWTFNTANTTFTTAIDVNTESTMAGLNIDATGVLKVGGTTVIDASRNMSNIGTISSIGAHTLDGDLAFTGPQAITTSTGDLTLNPAGAIYIGAKTISGTTAVIDFTNFDVSSTGAVTAASTINSAGGVLTDSAAVAVDNAVVDAPTIILRGSYDGNVGVGITALDNDATITHNLIAAGVSPTSQLEFDVGGGGAEMTLTNAGNLSVTGTINNQTIGATSSLAILNTSGDLTINQNSGVADDVYFAVQHNSGNIFTVDKDGDLYVSGNLQVEGTQTILNVQTVEVESSAIKMNRNVTGAPVLNASILVERGTSADTALRWNETSDIWDVTMDGTNYYGILHANTDLAGDVSGKYNNLQLGADVVGANELASTAIQSGDIEAGDLPADGYAATYVNVTGDTMSGSLTAASFTFDNSTLNAETWTTSAGDITLAPAGNNVLPSTDGTLDVGLGASIESLSGSVRDVGTGSLTLTTSGTWTTYVDNDLTYRVQIDGAGNVGVGTCKWSRSGGATWAATGVVTSATATALENGLSIAFGGTGGVVGDYWDITITKNTGFKNVFANTITTDDIYTPSLRPENTSGTITLTGSLSVTGDLTVTGQQSITGGTVYTGQEVVRLDHAQALLVEKSGAGGSGTDIFFVDTVDQNAELYSALGIGKSPASGVELDVLGDGAFSGTLSSTGNFAVNTNKFTVTAATGNTLVAGNLDVSLGLDVTGANLTLDSNDIVVNTNKFTVDGATGNTISAGILTSLSSIGLVPEYDNATPMGDGSDNFGTLTLKYGSAHNYYEWTTNEPTVQDYDIVVRYRLPDGFTSFDTTAPIKLWNDLSAFPNASTVIKIQLLDTNGTSVLPISSSTGTYASDWLTLNQNTSWTETTITINNSATELTSSDAGLYITLKVRLVAYQGDTVDVGEMTLKGNW